MSIIFNPGWSTLGVFFCILSFSSHAEDVLMIDLSVQPHLCVLSSDESMCRDDIEIKWKADNNYSLCLYADEAQEPLYCWKDSWHGNYELFIETSTAIDFYLKNTENSQILASQLFEVIQDVQQYRRRRRNPWSFF